LLVIAHPRRSSLTGQAADAFREAAQATSHTFELADLALERFDPVLREADDRIGTIPTRSIPRTCGARCSGSSATTPP
jgi:putative NADPH-quinone reductase